MVWKINSAITSGLDVYKVTSEIKQEAGLSGIIVVGLGDKAVQESKERIRSAIKYHDYNFPKGKIVINLSPANIAKTGTKFDLPLAVGILLTSKIITKEFDRESIFIGELGLDGEVKSASGILNICLWARDNGVKSVYIPANNSKEAEIVSGVNIYPVKNIKDVVDHLNEVKLIEPVIKKPFEQIIESIDSTKLYPNDFAYVKGQPLAKRALEIAAAGGHNIMMIGQPGSGKTMLARSYSTILPRLTEDEAIEITKIYSSSGNLTDGEIIKQRPFRSPHHSSSHISLVGGGLNIIPGEVTLAHRGILFLDEFPEFKRETIETLRQPLEDGVINISRAAGSRKYPCNFYLVAAANPTPSGYHEDDQEMIDPTITQAQINRYKSKFSGPIMDRIDIHVTVDKPTKTELKSEVLAERSLNIFKRVQAAREVQQLRYNKAGLISNSEMGQKEIKTYCKLDVDAEAILDKAIDTYRLSGRGYSRILKVARTIADLNGHKDINKTDLLEALQYRQKM